jgi:hypothetical protein
MSNCKVFRSKNERNSDSHRNFVNKSFVQLGFSMKLTT